MLLDVEQTAVILLAEQANLEVIHNASVAYAALYPIGAEAKWAFTVKVQPNFVSAFNTSYANFASLCKQRIRAHGYVPVFVIMSEHCDQATIVMTKVDVLPTAEEALSRVRSEAVVAHPQQSQAPAGAASNGHASHNALATLTMNNIAQALASFEHWMKGTQAPQYLDHDDYEIEDYELTVSNDGSTELNVYLLSPSHRFTKRYEVSFARTNLDVYEVSEGDNSECEACMREAHDNQSEANRLWDEGR